jgi:RNA polymerase sigma factor (TIGR02999 family)
MSDVTRILSKIESGDQQASEELLPLVYDELRKLAAARMANERADHTLQATALVHEAYVRLVDVDQAQAWNSRGHFFGAAGEAMRRILVDSARRKRQLKAGGGRQREELVDEELVGNSDSLDQVLEVSDALEKLDSTDPKSAELVRLRFFAGLSMLEISEVLDRPLRTLEREWTYAKMWLWNELSITDTPPS